MPPCPVICRTLSRSSYRVADVSQTACQGERRNAVAGPERKIDAQGVDTFIQAASAYAQAERKAAASMSTGNQILYQMGLVAPVVDFPAIVRKMAKPNG